MSDYQLGVAFGIATALCWTGSSIVFAEASRRTGSVPVNLIRLVIAVIMLGIVGAAHRGQPLPMDASPHQWTWLGLSGIVGFFIGDLTLFRAFVLIGPRRSTLLMALAPAFAAITDFIFFRVQLLPQQSLGIFITLVGVMWVIVERSSKPDAHLEGVSRWGITLGLLGALGQGVGSVLTHHAYIYGRFDPFGSTQIRALPAIVLFFLFILITRRSRDTIDALRNAPAMGLMTLGAFAGPFLGVSLFNASVARIPSGVTSTLAGMVPIFMLPIAAFVQKERITIRAVLGAIIAVAGVALLTLVEH